jgi:hypothetical protein
MAGKTKQQVIAKILTNKRQQNGNKRFNAQAMLKRLPTLEL